MASRLNLARTGFAVLGASAALLVTALPATAATPAGTPAPVTNVTVDGSHNKDWGQVDLVGHPKAPTALLALKPNSGGDDLFAYCVQIEVNEGSGANINMHQAPWTDYPNPNATFKSDSGKVNWILHNSYPTAQLPDLSKAAATPTTLSIKEAVEGTQAAIWHFSDNTDLDAKGRNGANVKALYQYLTSSAVDLAQPPADPTLSITAPAKTTGDTGTEIGPFVVNTTLQLVQLAAPQGVSLKVVDAAGHVVDPNKVVNGTKVFFEVPAGTSPGGGMFTVSGGLQVGQMFVGDPNAPIQTLILAQTSMLSAQSSANWVTPAPATTTTPAVTTTAGGTLPNTGVNVQAPAILSIVLIGAGGTFLLVQRRRKRA